MQGCHGSEVGVYRPFVITPYSAGETGVFKPAKPDAGSCHVEGGEACVLWVDHLRERKTEPCIALTVFECGTHGVCFTVYPPGHVPYGRVRVAPVALDGKAIVDRPSGEDAFEGTVFEAAMDASKGAAWDRVDPVVGSEGWGTQGRRVAAAVKILGVAPGLGNSEREAMAAALGVTLLLLLEQAKAIAARPGYRSRGQAIRAVLGQLGEGPCVLARLMASGHLAGLWGAPLRWDTQSARLRSWSFRGLGSALR